MSNNNFPSFPTIGTKPLREETPNTFYEKRNDETTGQYLERIHEHNWGVRSSPPSPAPSPTPSPVSSSPSSVTHSSKPPPFVVHTYSPPGPIGKPAPKKKRSRRSRRTRKVRR